jgi:hypothetical protein
MCVMLKALQGFEQRTNENKRFQTPFAVAHDATGRRWIITRGRTAVAPGETRPARACTPIRTCLTARRANHALFGDGFRTMGEPTLIVNCGD